MGGHGRISARGEDLLDYGAVSVSVIGNEYAPGTSSPAAKLPGKERAIQRLLAALAVAEPLVSVTALPVISVVIVPTAGQAPAAEA